MLAAVGWPDVLVALIAAVPAIIAAVFAGLARQEVKTANGSTLAGRVQETHDAAIEANGLVRRRLGERQEDETVFEKPRTDRTRLDDD